jgi:hypothetical protein
VAIPWQSIAMHRPLYTNLGSYVVGLLKEARDRVVTVPERPMRWPWSFSRQQP